MKNLTLITFLLLAIAGCKNEASANPPQPNSDQLDSKQSTVIEITSVEQFNTVISQKNRLIVIDLYADWCGPCRQLAPILREIAKTHGTRADFIKINSDKLPKLAQLFPTEGIPHVVFFKDSTILNTLTGLYPKDTYLQGVEIFSQPLPDSADGIVKSGIRQITIPSDIAHRNISSYKGDKIELTITPSGKPFTITSEQLKIADSSNGNSKIVVKFDTKEQGSFPIMLSDQSGREDRIWLLVTKYVPIQGKYREVAPKEFAEIIKGANSVLLDVRTPEEFAENHIKGATLIPVQELQNRISELQKDKSKTVLVYCRSGHRSTVASKILNESGFTSVVNLAGGISAWTAMSLPVEK